MSLILLFFMLFNFQNKSTTEDILKKIEDGNFLDATKMINIKLLEEGLSDTEKLDLKFELERMERIRLDFSKNEDFVLEYIKKYLPESNTDSMKIWRNEGYLEYKFIDGELRYFNRTHSNFFRVYDVAKNIKQKIDPSENILDNFCVEKINDFYSNNQDEYIFGNPIEIIINYRLTVEADAVPEGEIIRCWLPYPREGNKRQTKIELLEKGDVINKQFVIADNKNLQRTIYFEKRAEKGEKTEFNYSVKYISNFERFNISPEKVREYNKNSEIYTEFTKEEYPHIIFTDKIKALSNKIVGTEKNPYLITKKIFEWINNNIPWAGAREYSTIRNISDYCITNLWGDCGIKTITFITLARFNGIPARWQSGWMLHPVEVNLHDWGEFYLEGYGWVPVDQSFGIMPSDEDNVKYFYLGGMDAFRFITNDGFSRPLFPAKVFPRSETVDFQRGEVEWRGGNIYFNKWDYDINIEYKEMINRE